MDQFFDAYPPGIEQQYWHLARNRILEDHLRALCSKRVLDVGSGRGILVQHLISRGMDAYGVELAPVVVPSHLEGRLFSGTTAESLAKPFRASVDTLVLGDVVEHLPDPLVFLQTLSAAFEQADKIVITVPARQELWSNYDEYYGHYRRYEPADLRAMATAIGFTPIDVGYMFRFLYLPALLLCFLGKQRPTALTAPRLPSLHRAIAAAMRAEYRVLPQWIPGTSAICVAVRKTPQIGRSLTGTSWVQQASNRKTGIDYGCSNDVSPPPGLAINGPELGQVHDERGLLPPVTAGFLSQT